MHYALKTIAIKLSYGNYTLIYILAEAMFSNASCNGPFTGLQLKKDIGTQVHVYAIHIHV